MLGKFLATSLFLCFLCLVLAFYNSRIGDFFGGDDSIPKLILSSGGSYNLRRTALGPTLESVIQASTTDEGRELRFPGLAVTSTLKNACQPLTDVSKAKIPANKIALVILLLEDETACPMQDLALEAQRAGYSVLIYFALYSVKINTTPIYVPSKEILLIPVLEALSVIHFCNADRTNVEISFSRPPSKELHTLKSYLAINPYVWFHHTRVDETDEEILFAFRTT